jgi:hypothetical protein
LAGFSYYRGSDFDDPSLGIPFVSVWNVYHLDTGLDATYWGKSGVGFNMRILANLGTARARQTDSDSHSHSGLVGGSFMFGVSFAGL